MKQEIIHIALENLRHTAGIDGNWHENGPLDGVLDLMINGQKHSFTIEVKREIRSHQLPKIEDEFRKHKNFMILANRIFPNVKEELVNKQIPYLEANGNFFIKQRNIFIFVDTQKPVKSIKTKGNRAFTKTGLKVLFYLLQHKEHINLTQRELAEKTGVGLGNIPQVIEGLKETGFLIPLNNRAWVWQNRKLLLERWVAEYGTVLKPKLRRERYNFQGNWKHIHLNHELTVWGGEPAAESLTNYLRPEKLILYTKENRTSLMRNYRLIPNPDGEIETFEMFWQPDKQQTYAPAILVYADLLLEGGNRNSETAEKILNEYIKPKL